MPYQHEARAVLEMWREVERQIEGQLPDAADRAFLVAERTRLRIEYNRLIALAEQHHRPTPAPWSEREAAAFELRDVAPVTE